MMLSVIAGIAGLVFLMILHELGHFLIAKRLGVRVEEFGIGYPPRLFSARRGETIYSVNLVPFGAFVRLAGEDGESDDPKSYQRQSLWGRAMILSGGVAAFWIIAWIFYGILAGTSGMVMAISDDAAGTIGTPRVLVLGVANGSPAKRSGLLQGDTILSLGSQEAVSTVREVQEEINRSRGRDLEFLVERGGEKLRIVFEPRLNPPPSEGPAGIMLARVQYVKYPWYLAPLEGARVVWNVTVGVVKGLGSMLAALVGDREALKGVEVQGPVGITKTLSLSFAQGISPFLSLLSLIAVYLAVFNLLPIPVTDGGKLFLLLIQGMTGKTLPSGTEQKMNATVFVLLILLMIWVTIQDIIRIL